MNELSSLNLIYTIAIIALATLLKVFGVKVIKKKRVQEATDKRVYINTFKNFINLVLIVSLFYLWHEQLREFAFSIAAFVVAIVIATRELIQCVIGFVYLSSTTIFRIGDWVQVGHHTGEVTATDWAKITLLEVEQSSYSYTGRSVFIPNSQLMTQPIKNLNFMRRYINHSFTIVKNDINVNPYDIVPILQTKATEYCQDFHVVAERYNQLIENRLDISLPGPSPSVEVNTTDIGKIKVCFTVFCPTEKALELQQKLTQDFFNCWSELRKSSSSKEVNDE